MTWVTFVTVWIISQTVFKAASQVPLSRLKGDSEPQLVGRIIGSILWGILMIGSLYMAGLYS